MLAIVYSLSTAVRPVHLAARLYIKPASAILLFTRANTTFVATRLLSSPAPRTSTSTNMPPKQATLGKFFGADSNGHGAKKQQSTLSFKQRDTKASRQPNGRADEDKMEVSPGVDEDAANVVEEDQTRSSLAEADQPNTEPLGSKRAKRKTPEPEPPVNEDEDEDEEPIRKRARRGTQKEPAIAKPASAAKTKSTDDASGKGRAVKPRTANTVKGGKESDSPVASPDAETSAVDNDVAQEKDSNPSSEAEDEDDLDEDPKLVTKARKAVQTTLSAKSGAKDLFPDWTKGDPVPYSALCTTFAAIEMTTKRLIIMDLCSRFLRQVMRLTPDDLLPTVQLMINKLAADYQGIELGIGESLIMKAIGEATGRSLQVIKTDQNEIGDLGLVAAKSRSNQPTMFKPKPLTVRGVLQQLMKIATTQGHGSQQRKVDEIKKLLSASDVGSKGIDISKDKGGASESKFVIRFLEGKLRLGLAERTVLTSLAHAVVIHESEQAGEKVPGSDKLAEGEAILKTVYSELPNYEVIIPQVVTHGIFNLRDNCKLQPGVPLKPMLAKPTKSITEVLDRFEGKNFTCEYKYDGERAQIHYVAADSASSYSSDNPALHFPGGATTMKKAPTGISAIFSRNSEDLSKKYPDVLEKLHTWIKPETKSFVLDCETVAWDVKEKKVLPFQQLMTRKKKDVKTEDVKVKVCVYAFDMLYHNGEPVVQKTLRERRDRLHEAFNEVEGEFRFAQSGDTSDLDEIQTLLEESVKASCEGLMVKMLDTEESGYEPSKRSRNWLKVKKDYLAGVGDSLDLVVLGAYFGRGKRTSVYGAFLLACYNTASDTYETVCNIGTGFSDEVLAELHAELSKHTIDRPKPFYTHSSVNKDQPDVWFEPRFVWEVKTADLTLSPRYKAGADVLNEGSGKGISLRFPRFIKKRDDKKPDEATGSRMVVEMYRKQESVAKQKGPSVDDDFEY